MLKKLLPLIALALGAFVGSENLTAQGCQKLCGYSKTYTTTRYGPNCPDLLCKVTNCSGPSVGSCLYGLYCHDPEGSNYVSDDCAWYFCPCDLA